MVSQVADMPSVNEVIVHCQKQIKKDPPEDKLLHYLGRLTRLRITTQDLVETGIGRTVNQLSRHDGDVGSAARKLVRQWKAMVAEESKCSGSESNSGSSSNEDEDDDEEGEDADGDENGDGSTQFVEKEANNRHSDEDASSHNDQQSVSEAMEEDCEDHDSDVSDRLCIDDDVPTQPLHPQHKEKIMPSSSSESDSDSDGQEDADENHKGSSSESEHEDISSGYGHIKQEPIINNGNYDDNVMHANDHLEHQLKYEPKSSASSSRHSEDEYSDSSSHSPKRKSSSAFSKEMTHENANVLHKSKSTSNENDMVRKGEKKFDSSDDEKHRKRSSNSKSYDKHSKEKSNNNKSTERDKDSFKAVVVKKEPVDLDEEYEPEKPKYNSNREKVRSYDEKSKHREKDGEKSKRSDRETEKSKSNNKDSSRSKHHDKDREKDRDRSKRHEKSDKSKYNDSEKSKHSSQHKEKDRDRDRLGSKEKESKSSEAKSQSVKVKSEPGSDNVDKGKDRSSSREGKSSSDSKSSKLKTESASYDNYSERNLSNYRENKTSDSKPDGSASAVKVEHFGYENYYNDRSSSQKTSSGYSTVNSKPESGYDSYSMETDSNSKIKVKSDIKGEKSSSSSSRRDRDRDEKGKDKKDSKESPQERDRKERQREKDREREKERDSRKRKYNGELSDKEEQSSSKKFKESSESKKPKVEVEKSKPKKPKLVIRGEVDSTSGFNFADVLNCLDVSSSKSSSKKKDSKEKSTKKSVIVPPTSSKKDEIVSLVRKSDIDKLAAEKKKNRNKNGIIESIIAPTVNISPNYKPATNTAVLPKLPKLSLPSSAPLSLGSLGLNDPSNWEDSRATMYEDNCKADALSTMMSSRNARTKVFSGNKAGLKGEVPKLFDLCMHVIQENIQDLGFTGGVPYDILKPALERATATQLYNIEDCNPYLIEDTDELWKFHCSRDFRGRLPQELESWRELYLRCLDEREARFQSLTVKMKKKVEVAEPIRKTKLAYVETHIGGPRFSKSKAATIKNGMKSLKFREEKGVKRAHGMSASAGGSGTGPKGSGAGIVEEAAVIISSDSKAGSAPAPSVSREPSVAKMKPKKAPLMQKTFKLMKTLCRR